MYFTETPHLQSVEAMMKTIPRHPQAQESEQKEGSNMKLKLLSKEHRERFLELFKRIKTNPLCSEQEYCAAIYLLTADPELWKTVMNKVTDENIDFKSIKLGAVDCDRYALYKSAKDILCHKYKLSLSELRSMDSFSFNFRTSSSSSLNLYRSFSTGTEMIAAVYSFFIEFSSNNYSFLIL